MQANLTFASLTSKGPWSPADRIITAVLVIAFGLFYGFQVSDFPELEDDGLFVLASAFLGTAHSPGYPLFVLLSQVMHLLPVESVALRGPPFWLDDGVGRIGVALLYWSSTAGAGKDCLPVWGCLCGVLDIVLGTGVDSGSLSIERCSVSSAVGALRAIGERVLHRGSYW